MSKGSHRRRERKREAYRELDLNIVRQTLVHTELKRGVEYQVQQTAGANAEEGKTWICPECTLTIEPGLLHTVAWGVVRGPSTRRHFHNHCWKIFNGTLL